MYLGRKYTFDFVSEFHPLEWNWSLWYVQSSLYCTVSSLRLVCNKWFFLQAKYSKIHRILLRATWCTRNLRGFDFPSSCTGSPRKGEIQCCCIGCLCPHININCKCSNVMRNVFIYISKRILTVLTSILPANDRNLLTSIWLKILPIQ